MIALDDDNDDDDDYIENKAITTVAVLSVKRTDVRIGVTLLWLYFVYAL